ncbi:MFS transporter [Anaerovorax sp. IOR16]|uniref:MFS transporter n=1 Tax=Anaerovorax sp. IOR16 TaxID=2773458 RepID=UPI001FD6BAA1|nr:MFS transporter [Anaerovorax sp. IOR16]
MLNKMKCGDEKLKWCIFAITGMANFSVCFAINSLNLALPTLMDEFGVSQGEVSWLALVYTFIPCCMLLICGKAADIYGYKRQYQIGFCFFAVASVLAPILSDRLITLVFFRAMQGLGYCLLISITQATVTKTFDADERGKALGINAIFVSVGLASGPSIGGFLLTHFSWHSIFYFPIPFCLFGLIATIIIMPEDYRRTGEKRLDWPGGLFFAVFIGALAVGLNFSDDWGLRSVAFVLCIALSILSFMLFLWRENHTDIPMIELNLFHNKTFSFANAACCLSYMTQQLTTYLFPFFLIDIVMLKPDKAGIVMLSFPLAMMIASPFGGTLSDYYGTRRPAVAGLLLIALNCILVGFFNENSNIIFIILTLIMVGGGNGLSVSAINSAILGSVPKEYLGVASGTLATMRTIGNTFGTAIGSVMLITRQTHYSFLQLSDNEIYLFAQRDTFLIGLGLVSLAVLSVIKIPDRL